ncbi:MAG: DUF92 domain-containing protein [Acidobacteria bacterium]|nr:DUF92 domain-containing protein [Acidobacteriota bacterium]
MSTLSETRRQTVHIAMGGFALLLRAIPWWQAAILAALATLLNLFLLPRLGGLGLYRPVDIARGYPLGAVLYSLAVLLLIVAFPHRPDIAAAAWGVMALGDGSATLVGHWIGGRRIPWNTEKTVAGTVAFVVIGSLGGVFLAWWARPAVVPMPPLAFTLAAPIAAAIAAALVETIQVRLDDNISVPAVAAGVMATLSLVAADAVWAAGPTVAGALPVALLLNVTVAIAGWKARTVSTSGAIAGAIIGLIIYSGAGAGAWLLLVASFLAASASSRIGLKRKQVLGIAEEREGRRGAGNALANCGLAALAAILAVTTRHPQGALFVLVVALVAGGSDTVASEVGKAWGGRTYLITRWVRVPPGRPGAVSLEGTAAGIVAALGLAALGVVAGLMPASHLGSAVIGAAIGSVVESALAATFEGPGVLNNDLLNFLNTLAAVSVALAISGG